MCSRARDFPNGAIGPLVAFPAEEVYEVVLAAVYLERLATKDATELWQIVAHAMNT